MKIYFFFRRIIDTTIAVIAILVLSPILITIIIAICVDSKGNAIFKQKRIGLNGKPYNMYKFRSMITNAQNMGTGVYSFECDPRITKVGAFIRRTSLDELPQLWNIIKGDMAFIGPRSPVFGYFPKWDTLNDAYKRRFSVLPGISGLAQCVGRNNFSWDEKVKYDNIYIDNVNKYYLLYDIKMWLMTFARVLSMSDVAEKQENMEKNKDSIIGNNK